MMMESRAGSDSMEAGIHQRRTVVAPMTRADLTAILIGPVSFLARERECHASPHRMKAPVSGYLDWMRCEACGLIVVVGPLEATPVDKEGYLALLSMEKAGWLIRLPVAAVGYMEHDAEVSV